jgi:GNAT superfamily N-acetyltransferase
MPKVSVKIRSMQEGDIPAVVALCHKVYVGATAWSPDQLHSQLQIFPRGQLVALHPDDNRLIAYAASLVINWDDYDFDSPWRDVTEQGFFTNHDPENGRTLYGAEVMVDPDMQGSGVGTQVYEARRLLVRSMGLLRIRAGARLRNYHNYIDQGLTPQDYVMRVTQGLIFDATLSFQLKQGFQVLGVVGDYLREDPESRGFAAVIEWINPVVANSEHFQKQRRSPYFTEDFKIQS